MRRSSVWKVAIVAAALISFAKPAEASDWFDYLFGKPTLEKEWSFRTGKFDEGAAEIVAFDAKTKRLFVTNGDTDSIDVLKAVDGTKLGSIDVSDLGSPTSVAAHKGLVVISVDAPETGVRGNVVFANAKTLARKSVVQVGFLPDMVTFTPNGKVALVANEGERNDDYDLDPVGSISIIKVGNGSNPIVTEAGFEKFNSRIDRLRARGIRIFGPGATVAQDLEPEYITVSPDSKTAYVSLQENNAVAIVDIKSRSVKAIHPFGFKNHSVGNNKLDASNRDDAINIQNWPALGMYQPESMATVKLFGLTFLLTANEGDARDYDGYSEEARVEDLTLDPTLFPNASELQDEANLGRLKTTTSRGDIDGDGDFDKLYSYGGRSFSIWLVSGSRRPLRVFDSADGFEQVLADQFPEDFNSTNDENDSFDNRSDDKGPEPEAITVGKDIFQTYSFVGLERMSGIMVYEITNPFSPRFIEYKNTRDFTGDPENDTAGDLAPEAIVFLNRKESPFVEPAIVVSNEVSGSTTLYRIKRKGGLLSGRFNGE